MPLMDILGMSEEMFGKNAFYIGIIIMLLLYVIFGIKFIKDSRAFDKGSAARGYYVGLGFFIITVAFGEAFYLIDLMSRTYLDGRLFLTLNPGGIDSVDDWQYYAGVQISSLINRDYYVAIFLVLMISLSFLMKPLEIFMLKRDKPIVTYVDRILIPVIISIRVIEINYHNWFGTTLLSDSIAYYIFTGLWILIIIMLALSIAILIGLYLKMAKDSPKGSNLRKKSFLIILGIFLWMIAFFLTKTVHDMLDSNWYVFPVIPLFLILSLGCMISGFKREY